MKQVQVKDIEDTTLCQFPSLALELRQRIPSISHESSVCLGTKSYRAKIPKGELCTYSVLSRQLISFTSAQQIFIKCMITPKAAGDSGVYSRMRDGYRLLSSRILLFTVTTKPCMEDRVIAQGKMCTCVCRQVCMYVACKLVHIVWGGEESARKKERNFLDDFG